MLATERSKFESLYVGLISFDCLYCRLGFALASIQNPCDVVVPSRHTPAEARKILDLKRIAPFSWSPHVNCVRRHLPTLCSLALYSFWHSFLLSCERSAVYR